jgi:2-C-methyl-D-erythritol 4-phosphate cytidylyltransferase
MSEQAKIWVVVPAAGIGTRMESDIPKQYMKIQDKCILEHTLEKFCFYPGVEGVVVALASDDPFWAELSISTHEKLIFAAGGVERCHSVLNGLRKLEDVAEPDDWVMVHDAARPCVRTEDIARLINTVRDNSNGGLLAVPVRDTMKRADSSNCVAETVDRSGLWHALTPQMFRLSALTAAIENALEQELLVTDEAQAMEFVNIQPLLIEGHPDNIKVTHPQDLLLAELFLSQQES